jgi:hypothetical protein
MRSMPPCTAMPRQAVSAPMSTSSDGCDSRMFSAGQQRLPTGQHARVVAVLRQQVEGLLRRSART